AQARAVGTMTAAIVVAMASEPATAGSAAGRNVVTAPSAKVQAFGLMSWNVAACQRLNGLAIVACRMSPARAICQARYRRYRDPRTFMTSARPGTALTRAASPSPAASAIAAMPRAVPSTCGSVLRSPNVAPDAHSIRLLGPGEPELATEKTMS